MRITLLLLSIVLVSLSVPVGSQSAAQETKLPCSIILDAKDNMPINAKGAALAYQVKTELGTDKTSLSIHAQYLPDPSSLGNYDRYEGFAQVPDVISWRFPLYPTPEPEIPTWSGRLDDITGTLERASVQVRLSNSKTNTLGPVVLENHMKNCK